MTAASGQREMQVAANVRGVQIVLMHDIAIHRSDDLQYSDIDDAGQ